MISSTQNMNTVQYIFAAVEGGLCSALAMAFIIASTTKMNLQVCRGREVPWAGGWHSSCHPHGLMAFIIASIAMMILQVCRGREVPWAGGWHSSCHPHGLMALIIASTAKMILQVRVGGWVWVDID